MGKRKSSIKLSVKNVIAGLFVVVILWGAWQALGGASLAGTSEITMSESMQGYAANNFLLDPEKPGVYVVAIGPAEEPVLTNVQVKMEIEDAIGGFDLDTKFDANGNEIESVAEEPEASESENSFVEPIPRQSLLKTWWQKFLGLFRKQSASIPTTYAKSNKNCGPNCPLKPTISTKALNQIISSCEKARAGSPGNPGLANCRTYETAKKILTGRNQVKTPPTADELVKIFTKKIPARGPFRFESRKVKDDGSGISRSVVVYVNSSDQTEGGLPDFDSFFGKSGTDSATLAGELTGILQDGGWEPAPWVEDPKQPVKPPKRRIQWESSGTTIDPCSGYDRGECPTQGSVSGGPVRFEPSFHWSDPIP